MGAAFARQARPCNSALVLLAVADTSLILDEATLCSPPLLAAVRKARPRPLLLSIQGGITARTVSCLRALPTPRLYLAGCLYSQPPVERPRRRR